MLLKEAKEILKKQGYILECRKKSWKTTGLYDENDNQDGYSIEDIDDALKSYCVFDESVNEAMAKQNDDDTYDVDLDDETTQRIFNSKKQMTSDAEKQINDIIDNMESKGFIYKNFESADNEYHYGTFIFEFMDRNIPVETSIYLLWVPGDPCSYYGTKSDYRFGIDTDVSNEITTAYCGKYTKERNADSIDDIVKAAIRATKLTATTAIREINNK